MSFLDFCAMKQHDGNQLNNAPIGVLNLLPCSHSVFHVGDRFQRLRSGIALTEIIVRSVAMLLKILESLRHHQKIIGLIRQSRSPF